LYYQHEQKWVMISIGVFLFCDFSEQTAGPLPAVIS
jgi:hypothetical protein